MSMVLASKGDLYYVQFWPPKVPFVISSRSQLDYEISELHEMIDHVYSQGNEFSGTFNFYSLQPHHGFPHHLLE